MAKCRSAPATERGKFRFYRVVIGSTGNDSGSNNTEILAYFGFRVNEVCLQEGVCPWGTLLPHGYKISMTFSKTGFLKEFLKTQEADSSFCKIFRQLPTLYPQMDKRRVASAKIETHFGGLEEGKMF